MGLVHVPFFLWKDCIFIAQTPTCDSCFLLWKNHAVDVVIRFWLLDQDWKTHFVNFESKMYNKNVSLMILIRWFESATAWLHKYMESKLKTPSISFEKLLFTKGFSFWRIHMPKKCHDTIISHTRDKLTIDGGFL